jgi:hypothetical protein
MIFIDKPMKCVLDNIGNSIEVTALGAIMLSSVIAAINLTTTYGRNTILKHMLTTSAVLVTFIGEFVFLFTDGDFEFFYTITYIIKDAFHKQYCEFYDIHFHG